MDKSFLSGILTGYETKRNEKGIPMQRTFYSKKISGSMNASDATFVMRALRRLSRALYLLPCRFFGTFLLSLGLATLLSHFAKFYFLSREDVFLPLIFGVLETMLAVILMIPEKPLALALQSGRLTEYIFFDFFCFKRVGTNQSPTNLSPVFAVLLGIAMAALGYFTLPYLPPMLLMATLFLALSFASPEFPFFLTLLLLPFLPLLPHPTLVLCITVFVTAISFARKVFLGNRVYTLEQYDVLLIVFSSFYLLSGAFQGGESSLNAALEFLILALGYTLASNLITNERLASRAVGALLFSAAPISVLALYQYFSGMAEHRWMDTSFIGKISGRVTATFDNPNILAVYLLAVCVIAFGFFINAKQRSRRALYALSFILSLAALILTWCRGAWLALLITIPTYLILRFMRRPGILLSLLFLIPCALLLMPSAMQDRLLSIFNLADSSIAYRLSIFRSSLSMLGDNLFLGIGLGADNFYGRFAPYAEEGVIAPHSHNLLLQIGCEAGIFALACFLLLLFARIHHLSAYGRFIRRSSMNAVTVFGTMALFSLLILGMTDYIWFAPPMYYLFFVFFGMGSASLRIAKEDDDDRLSYYGDARRADSSVIDIIIN